MFKRTKGYWLLILLVLTGLAGKIHTTTLSGKERRALVKELKTSRVHLLDAVENLSGKQLNFKLRTGLSIKQYIFQLASIENNLWQTTNECLHQEPLRMAKSFTDEELTSCLANQQYTPPTEPKFKNLKEALKFYKNENDKMVKYINTSTENIRSHIIHTLIGNLDAYQLLLMNTVYTNKIVAQINSIKSSPNFPK